MQLSALGINQLRIDESKKLRAYYDVNGWAIGYGWHNYASGKEVRQGDVITDAECETQFPQVLAQFAEQVRKALTVKLSDNQFTALVMYSYNRGIGSFRSSNLRKMVNSNPKNLSIPAQFSIEWGTNQKDKIVILKRRAREAKIWQTPDSSLDYSSIVYVVLFLIFGFILYKMVTNNPEPETQRIRKKQPLFLNK
jgi:lysozyme